MTKGLVIAGTASGSGKTTVTLGLLRALHRVGVPVRAAKSGPDYIDPRFHEAATRSPAINLDAWAMPKARLRELAQGEGLLVVEGAMGLFDGAPPDGAGSSADLAKHLALPVVLIVNAAHMAQSVGAVVAGFAGHDPNLTLAGVILNNVGSPRHETMLRRALEPSGLPVLGAVPRQADLALPSRHLGLVQAEEHGDLEPFLDRAADCMGAHIDLDQLQTLARPLAPCSPSGPKRPPAQSIAIARDRAFAFSYPHMLRDWQAAGATLSFFSPLADEAPPPADLIFLPGGYPELFAGQLAAASNFQRGMRRAAMHSQIYGECGGYMTLGTSLIDAGGVRHAMVGLLPLETSFEHRKLHLGYRQLTPLGGPFTSALTGHEFHYATTLRAEGQPLFEAKTAEGSALPPLGLINGRVCGSFAHVIDWHD